jgi:hypothetical protein
VGDLVVLQHREYFIEVARRMPYRIDTVRHPASPPKSLNRSSLFVVPRRVMPRIRAWKHRQFCSPTFSLNLRERASLVHGDVISFVALDLILWITFSGVMHVTFVLHVVRVYLYNNAFNVSGFGVPSDMVSNTEFLHHSRSFQDTGWQALVGGSHRTRR